MFRLSPSSSARHHADQVGTILSTPTEVPGQAFNGIGSVSCGSGTNLPVSLHIGDYKVWDYLAEVMSRGWTDAGPFRLSPAYSLYLASRFFHSHSKAYLVQFFTRIAHHLNQISQECTSRDELLFWLANASELSFLVDRDQDLAGQLITAMENVFRRLCTVLVGALRPSCKKMLDVTIPVEDGNELLSLLDGTLRAARASRLNAALTIQLCSHVLHAINATLFNTLVGSQCELRLYPFLCLWARLASIHSWAEQMGVELAAECHLDRSRQAAALLAAQKNDVAALGATCYKLNSLQVRFLLTHFSVEDGEIPCDDDVINRVVGLAERQADNLTLQDGRPITLAETEQLLLPFLFPQDGYTAEQLRGVPDGLMQYLLSLQEKGLCHSVSMQESDETVWQSSQLVRNTVPVRTTVLRSSSQSTLGSLPTTHFGDSLTSVGEEIVRVILKRNGGSIGLSIVAAQGVGDRQIGIYVKKVVVGSPAALDGRLTAGDQLLSVNGHSLLGISQEEAAEYMARAGAEVRLEVRKGAALRNGLDAWLCQPVQPTTVSD
uniref:PDZ domain-containing protein n=1 Tax=Angiostrongylus cantonensis TaxID=6313 RepID=A0A158P7N3_ANGCA